MKQNILSVLSIIGILHSQFKQKELFNANENIHIIKYSNKNARYKPTFVSASDSLFKTSRLAKQES